MKASTFSLWLPLVLLVATGLHGALIAPQSILTLEKTADLIVVATASGTVQSGTTVNFSLQVNRVINGGGALPGTSIGASWMNINQDIGGSGTVGDASYSGIWFLRRTGSTWRVIPVMQGTMVFTKIYFPTPDGPISSVYAYAQAAPLADKIASEISFALENNSDHSLRLYFLQSGLLDELGSPVLNLLYQRMTASNSTEQRALGLGGLIRAGNASALAPAAQAASVLGDAPAAGALLLSIREYFRRSDADSVVTLGKATADSSNAIAFREVAAHALAAIHTTAALPFLATLLDDADPNIRAEAVSGIGAFANGLAIQTRAGIPSLAYLQLPTSAPYKTPDTVAHLAIGRSAVMANEASLVSFWKGWWAQNHASLGY